MVQQCEQTHLLNKKKKKKKRLKAQKYRKFLSGKHIPNYKTKQNKKKKAQKCLPQQIPNSQYKNQKIEKIKNTTLSYSYSLMLSISLLISTLGNCSILPLFLKKLSKMSLFWNSILIKSSYAKWNLKKKKKICWTWVLFKELEFL